MYFLNVTQKYVKQASQNIYVKHLRDNSKSASTKRRNILWKAKEKYRGVFEIQKSGDKTSSGEIGLDIRTHASPKVGQDQVSGGVSVLCWHAAPSKRSKNLNRKPTT